MHLLFFGSAPLNAIKKKRLSPLLFLYQLFKVEEGLILSGFPHTGGEHLVGGLIFLEALGHHLGKMHPVEAPVSHSGKRFRAVAVAGVGRVDPAAQFLLWCGRD